MNEKIDFLNLDLDEASEKYLLEQITEWKESVLQKLTESVEEAKADKLEELERSNFEYREELREEYSQKLEEAISEFRDAIKAEVTASVLKNNPELKILEQIKEIIAPTLDEDYRMDAYSDTIARLVEENETLRRNSELAEGAEELSNLLSPYSPKVQNLVLSLIKEGSPEEVNEQFVDIMSSLQEAASNEDDDDDEDDDDEDEDETSKSKDDDDEDDDDDDEDEDDDEEVEESFIDEGYDGDDYFPEDEDLNEDAFSMKNMMKKFI